MAEWLQLIASTINWRLLWQRLWALVYNLKNSWKFKLVAELMEEIYFVYWPKLHSGILENEQKNWAGPPPLINDAFFSSGERP